LEIKRLPSNPIIHRRMKGLGWGKGDNINGPTLMQVPPWVTNPLGKYYLYFAHHKGKYIRLAYADQPEGPFTVYSPGVLSITNTPFPKKHIASPEIYVDHEKKVVRMYFHINIRGEGVYSFSGQMTFRADSHDGLHFTSDGTPLAPFYLRVFRYQEYFYGLVKYDNECGMWVRSKDGITEFEPGPKFIPNFRHCTVYLRNTTLYVIYTIVGEAPEKLLLSTVDVSSDWTRWIFSNPIEVLRPELPWEGANLPKIPSKHGSTKPANALRDPFLYVEGNSIYLFYSYMGESGIAAAKIIDLFEK
jgi:hypothetical protein